MTPRSSSFAFAPPPANPAGQGREAPISQQEITSRRLASPDELCRKSPTGHAAAAGAATRQQLHLIACAYVVAVRALAEVACLIDSHRRSGSGEAWEGVVA